MSDNLECHTDKQKPTDQEKGISAISEVLIRHPL